MHVDINLLGGFAVVIDGRAVAAHAWSRRSAATLVKLLALRPGRQLPREQVVDLLWPDLLLEQAAPRLHKAAHYARTAVGVPSAVVLAGDVVALLPDAEVVVDVERFDRASGIRRRSTRRSGSTAATCCPRTSTSRGPTPSASGCGCRTSSCSAPPAAGPSWWPPSRSTRRRTCGWCRSRSRPATAPRRCASSSRWRGSGATSSARSPARRLGPCTRGRRRCQRSSRRPCAAGAGSTRVPRPATPTVGRGRDVTAALSLLDDHRLVTLLGIGGVGKTRLAAEVAHE